MKKSSGTPLADEYLQSIEGVKEAETAPYFYTRLKARMEKEDRGAFRLPAKLVWLVSMLVVFLFINGVVLFKEVKEKPASGNASIQNFANGYGLSVSSSF